MAQPGNQDITIEPWTLTLFERNFNEGLVSDRVIVNISIVLLISYSLLVLGTCHPVGCRAAAATIGIGSTMMAYAASYGLCCLVGLEISNMHPLLPFLLLGIGADDMYVIVAVVDQLNPRMSYKRVVAKALKFGGVSILITSFTDAVAFMLSGLSSVPALPRSLFSWELGSCSTSSLRSASLRPSLRSTCGVGRERKRLLRPAVLSTKELGLLLRQVQTQG